MPEDNSKKDKTRLIPSMSPTSATDYINIALNEQGLLMLQMISSMPDFHIENHRTIVSPSFVENFIKSLCEITNYYPRKPRKSSKSKKTRMA